MHLQGQGFCAHAVRKHQRICEDTSMLVGPYLALGPLLLAPLVLVPPLLAFVAIPAGGRRGLVVIFLLLFPAIRPGDVSNSVLLPIISGVIPAPLLLDALAVLPEGPLPPASVDECFAETTTVHRVQVKIFVNIAVVGGPDQRQEGKGRWKRDLHSVR